MLEEVKAKLEHMHAQVDVGVGVGERPPTQYHAQYKSSNLET